MRRGGNFAPGTAEYKEAYERAKPLAEDITKRQRSCIETRDLLLYDTYAAIMLAIEDIKNPADLKAQSAEMLIQKSSTASPSSASAVASSQPYRWDLPEKYPDTMMQDLVDSKSVYYALAAFFFNGKAAPNSEDNRIQSQAKKNALYTEGNVGRRTRSGQKGNTLGVDCDIFTYKMSVGTRRRILLFPLWFPSF